MSILSNTIEEFIKALMTDGQSQVDLQRNELAEYFHCAPSQINYVLATRFTTDKGYYIESHRGGGGYVRVLRINLESDNMLLSLINHEIGSQISERKASQIIERLEESDLISSREADIMTCAVSNKTLNAPIQIKDIMRACILRAMLTSVITHERKSANNQSMRKEY